MKAHLFILFFVILILSSCSNETQSYKLNLNENTYLLDDEPYTGLVIDRQQKTNRIIRSFNCIHGKINGEYQYYLGDGKIHFKKTYKNGVLNGTSKQFYYSGRLRSIENFKNGLLDGKQKEFFDDSKSSIQTISHYNKNKLNGYYYRNDRNISESAGNYKNGYLNGKWIFKKGGKLFAQGCYNKGDWSDLGATGIPRKGRIGKWFFYEPPIVTTHNYLPNSDWFEYKRYKNGKLVYSSKVNIITEEEIVYFNNL